MQQQTNNLVCNFTLYIINYKSFLILMNGCEQFGWLAGQIKLFEPRVVCLQVGIRKCIFNRK